MTTLKRRSIFSSMCVVGALCSTTIESSRGLLSLNPVSSFVARYLAIRSEGGGVRVARLFFFPIFRPASALLRSFSSFLVPDFKAATAFAIRLSVYGRHCETKAALCLLRAFRLQLTLPRWISIPSLFIVCSFDIRLSLDCDAREILHCRETKNKIGLQVNCTQTIRVNSLSLSRHDELVSDVHAWCTDMTVRQHAVLPRDCRVNLRFLGAQSGGPSVLHQHGLSRN